MAVKDISVDTFWKGEVRVSGQVEDQGAVYQTKIYVKGSQIIDYSCSCCRGNSFRGVCSHGQELYQVYKDSESPEAARPVFTSSSARLMIREYTNRQVAQIVAEEEKGEVEFIPRLLFRRREILMEAGLKKGREYQLKDLASFALAMREGRYVEYGRGLAFNHDFQAFTEESRKTARLTAELAFSYLEHYRQIRRGGMPAEPALRALRLSRGDLDRFFGLNTGRAIRCEDVRGQQRELTVVREDPDFAVLVKRAGKSGISVTVPSGMAAFEGEKSLYVADEHYIFCCSAEYGKVMGIFLTGILGGQEEPGKLLIHERDVPLFYERVLSRMEPLGILSQEGVELESWRPEPLKAVFDFDCDEEGRLCLIPRLSYGDYSFHPLDDGDVPKNICRDVPGEFRISRLITRYFAAREEGAGRLFLPEGEEAVYRLLDEGMEEFRSLGEIRLSGSVKALTIRRPPEISMGVSVSDGWLTLTVDTGDLTGGELLKVLDAYTQKKKYYRLKNGEFLKLSDDGFMTIETIREGLSLGKAELAKKNILLPSFRALYLDQALREDGHISLKRDSGYKALIRGMKSVEDSDYDVPSSFTGELKAYQKTGYRWLRTLDHWGFGGILADDMGLGKTIQVIALLLSAAQEGTSLIVCPASLIYNWEHELYRFAPSLKTATAAGTMSERQELLERMGEYQVVITSYELLKRDQEWYEKQKFRFQIIDEAQCIKNAATKSAKAVKAVRARTRFALTGTPVENHLGELWSIFDYLMPGFLFSYQKFRKLYEIPIVKEGNETAASNLRRLIGPFVLRRLKRDVMKELPEKVEKIVYSAFSGEQKKLYGASVLRLKEEVESGEEKFKILSGLTRLRQICCDPSLCYENYRGGSAKLDTCMDVIAGAVPAGHRILLFSQFSSMFPLMEKRLSESGIDSFTLTGSTPKEERNRLAARFNAGEAQVFLISLKAGGTGLNLTGADFVILYDPWWNAAAENQASDRAHRIGQRRQVTVVRLISKGTVEENILRLQESKRELADRIVTTGTVSLAGLNREEILRLLE